MKNIVIVLVLSLINPVAFAEELGKKTYEVACQNCHAPKLAKAIKAPAAFDKKVWDSRFQEANLAAKKNPGKYKSSIDYLMYSVKIGKGLMYHGGLCREANVDKKYCSNDALIDAIYYMSHRYKPD